MENTEIKIYHPDHYVLPATLEKYLERGLLLEYLRTLDDDSLELAIDYLEMDDIDEVKHIIYNLIQKEFKFREDNCRKAKFPQYIGKYIVSEKRTLAVFLANHKLTEYLQTLDNFELDMAEKNLYVDDIAGIAIDILGAIRIEKEYRSQQEEINKAKK